MEMDTVAIKTLLFAKFIMITFIVGCMFAPSGLAPVILGITGHSLSTSLGMRDMRLAFFSAFPRFKLGISRNFLISGMLGSDLPRGASSLLTFGRYILVIGPLSCFLGGGVDICGLSLGGITICTCQGGTNGTG